MKQHPNEEICRCCLAYRKGTPVTELVKQFGVARSTIYFWIKKYKDMPQANPESYFNIKKRHVIEMQQQERYKSICEILQKVDCTVSDDLRTKLYALEQLHGQYKVRHLCEALQVNRGTFYNHILRNKKHNSFLILRKEKLQQAIQEIYDDSKGIYGAKKIHAILRRNGMNTSLEYVKKLMREMNIKSTRDSAKRQFLKEMRPQKKNLVQSNYNVAAPNRLWVGDITQFHFKEHTFYICVILDIYSRKIVGYRISNRSTTQLVTKTFKLAYSSRQPEKLTFHSDRGCQYTSYAYQKLLSDLKVSQSYSRPRTPGDNSVAESFFATLKKEELYRKIYTSVEQFKSSIIKYITFYNDDRIQKSLGYKSPTEKENEYKKLNP